MASARLERTTIDLRDGTGRTGLRATGQVVIFPGFLTLYEEGVDDSEDENAKLLPRLREGDAPAKKSVSADQHFTQRSEEHTSELQSLMRISYAVFCLKKKKNTNTNRKQRV